MSQSPENTLEENQETKTNSSIDYVKTYEFSFHGTSMEFFKIWVVNIVLTILTLGIYSAWAKVRTTRYFYGNTHLAGASFEYTAEPMQILKGRVIAFAILVIYAVAPNFSPILQPIFTVTFWILLPWIFTRSLKFKLQNTRYRNIALRFDANNREAYLIFYLMPLLLPLTAGLIYPYFQYRLKRFILNQSRYGQAPFQYKGVVGDFYKIYAMALLLLVFFGFFIIMTGALFPILPPILMVPLYIFAFSYIQARITNNLLNNTNIDDVELESNLEPTKLASIYLGNLIGIIISLGLLIPWSMIRLAKYKAECTQVVSAHELSLFTEKEENRQNALGEEVGEMFDLDIGL